MRKLVCVLFFVTLLIPLASAYTASNLAVLSIREDSFYNYDFCSDQVSSTNVDWPVTMLFDGNAEVDKVKDIYFGITIFANSMYEELNDGDGWVWDTDRGTKGIHYSTYLNAYVYLHMRVYAPSSTDRMYNDAWGYYVLGTTHYDEFPWESWSGYSEYAENDFASIARSKGYFVLEDIVNFYNYESYREEGNHIWLNDGYATSVYVP